jgi:hypothetical protein
MRDADLELDVAFALERFPFVVAVLAMDEVADGYRFAVSMRPYTMNDLVEAHYALLAVTNHDTTGRVLYVNADQPIPRVVALARPLRVPPMMREIIRARVDERAIESRRVWQLEREAMNRDLLRHAVGKSSDEYVAASLQSGQFSVVRDPFPSDKLPRSRVLVVDEDLDTAWPLRTLGELDVEFESDGWRAIERIVESNFDLVLCSLKLQEWGASTIHRLVARNNRRAASRIVLLAPSVDDRHSPESVRARVLMKPIDPDAVRELLKRWRENT